MGLVTELVTCGFCGHHEAIHMHGPDFPGRCREQDCSCQGFLALTGRYRTIVVDPPWDYAGKTPPWSSQSSTPRYNLMPLDEIKALPVNDLASLDAHLYLWAVLPMMREAYEVVGTWGFKADTVVTWCKPGAGLGGGYRGNTEHLIVARRGDSFYNPNCAKCKKRMRGSTNKCACTEPEWRVKGRAYVPNRPFLTTAEGTWYEASRAEHSVKPDLFMDLIERMSPAPRLEMFARRQRLGWETWGDQALNHAGFVTEDAA